jgi:hypothetical protein
MPVRLLEDFPGCIYWLIPTPPLRPLHMAYPFHECSRPFAGLNINLRRRGCFFCHVQQLHEARN